MQIRSHEIILPAIILPIFSQRSAVPKVGGPGFRSAE